MSTVFAAPPSFFLALHSTFASLLLILLSSIYGVSRHFSHHFFVKHTNWITRPITAHALTTIKPMTKGQEMLRPSAGVSSKVDKKLVDDDSEVDTESASMVTDPLDPLVLEGIGEREEEEVVETDPREEKLFWSCLLYTSPSPRDQRGSRMPSSA